MEKISSFKIINGLEWYLPLAIICLMESQGIREISYETLHEYEKSVNELCAEKGLIFKVICDKYNKCDFFQNNSKFFTEESNGIRLNDDVSADMLRSKYSSFLPLEFLKAGCSEKANKVLTYKIKK
jgi:hypothetical protein